MPIKEYVIEDVKELCCPLPKLLDSENSAAEHPLSAEFNITKRMSWFVDRAMQVGASWLYTSVQLLTDNHCSSS